jgi:HSP20 family protein
MSIFRETGLVPRTPRDVSSLLRQMRSELDEMFEQPFWGTSHLPAFFKGVAETPAWAPRIEVFEKDHRLVTRAELPGLKKEDIKVEIADGQLAISGERKREFEQKKDNVFRSEREYGSFYRSVPLPDGVKLEDVKATFADGVLEVSVPLPARPEAAVRTVEIQEPAKAAKTAA